MVERHQLARVRVTQCVTARCGRELKQRGLGRIGKESAGKVVRHDAAWWVNNNSVNTLLVVFGNGEQYFKDETLFPEIAKSVYEYNNKLG